MFDCVVIGGGVVGSAIAYGLALHLDSVLMIDGRDSDPRAAQANFGLVWYQSKGVGMPAYQRLSRLAVEEWRSFSKEIEETSGIPIEFAGQGGLTFCLGDQELEARQTILSRLAGQMERAEIGMLSRRELERLYPGIRLGKDVTGGAFSALDGHVNPLRLLMALQQGFVTAGGTVQRGRRVDGIEVCGEQFRLHLKTGVVHAARVVIAAGEASRVLAEPLGMTLPFTLQRGQILVTERVGPVLPYPSDRIRHQGECRPRYRDDGQRGSQSGGPRHQGISRSCACFSRPSVERPTRDHAGYRAHLRAQFQVSGGVCLYLPFGGDAGGLSRPRAREAHRRIWELG
ncbi:MAG: FAD-dependent oxidoreductase [Gluconobacter oxydans]